MSSDPLHAVSPLEMVGGDDAPACVDGVCELPVSDDASLDD